MLTRKQIREIAERITNEELDGMLENAKNRIWRWTEPSICNKNYTKGWAWNNLAKGFNVGKEYNLLTKVTMVKEFQEYLPGHLKYLKDKKREPIHQDPEF